MSAPIDEPARRRFRWQFGLRTLLGVILLACVAFAYLAHYRREYEREFDREQPAIKAIAEIGGKCEMSVRAHSLALLLVRSEKLSRVVAVDLSYRETGSGIGPQGCIHFFSLHDRVTDAWLEQLAPLEHVETLDLSGNAISGEGLAVVGSLKRLKTLNLSDCAIEESHLARLGPLKELQSLRLHDVRVGDEGLGHISALTNLVELRVGRVAAEGSDVARLEPFKKLQSLRLDDVRVGDEGLGRIGALTNLVELRVGRAAEVPVALDETQEQPIAPKPAITVDGLRHLQALRLLERLSLYGAVLGESEIEVLEALPNLQELDVSGSRITPPAIDRFRQWTSLCELRLSHSSQPAEITAILDLKKARPKLIVDVNPPILPDGSAPRPPPPPP